jgi:hypothetical protein
VSRRPDPERIYSAQRAGTVARLTDRLGSTKAEALVARWEAEAARRGVGRDAPAYWSEAERWFKEQAAP